MGRLASIEQSDEDFALTALIEDRHGRHCSRRHSPPIDSPLHAVGLHSGDSVESVRTLSVTADYRLSEAGRKASLLNGGNGRAEQRVKIAVPLTRLHLVHVDDDGIARLKLRPQIQAAAPTSASSRSSSRPSTTTRRRIDDAAPGCRAQSRTRARVSRAADDRTPIDTARDARRSGGIRWRWTFLGDPNRRAVVYPPPSTRRCQIMTERGPVHFDAKRDVGIARQVPLEALPAFRRRRSHHATGKAPSSASRNPLGARRKAADDARMDRRARHPTTSASALSAGVLAVRGIRRRPHR